MQAVRMQADSEPREAEPDHVHHIHNGVLVGLRASKRNQDIMDLEDLKKNISAKFDRDSIAREMIFKSVYQAAVNEENDRKKGSIAEEELRRQKWEEREHLAQKEAAESLKAIKDDYYEEEAIRLIKLNKRLDEIDGEIDLRLSNFPSLSVEVKPHLHEGHLEEHTHEIWDVEQPFK